jgi:hypothetical protein
MKNLKILLCFGILSFLVSSPPTFAKSGENVPRETFRQATIDAIVLDNVNIEALPVVEISRFIGHSAPVSHLSFVVVDQSFFTEKLLAVAEVRRTRERQWYQDYSLLNFHTERSDHYDANYLSERKWRPIKRSINIVQQSFLT